MATKSERLRHHYDSAPPQQKNPAGMDGFDPEFTDIVDYIKRITYRIWEGKQVGLCYDYYATDCPIYTLAGISFGAEEVVQNTLNTLAAFPDRSLHAENIICGGNAGDGFHSSHRIRTEMTNTGDSDFGAATGRHVMIPVIAHCVVKNNQVIEEWLVRDNYSLVRQLGFDPEQVAIRQAQIEPTKRFTEWYDSELTRLCNIPCQRLAFSATVEEKPDLFIRTMLQNIWNARMLGDVYVSYAENAKLHAPSAKELNGHEAIIQYYLQMLGSFSGLRVSIDYICFQTTTDNQFDVAARWTMAGKHTGSALYGAPTGSDTLILGESHYRISEGVVQEEWTVFDELSILAHLYRARSQTATK